MSAAPDLPAVAEYLSVWPPMPEQAGSIDDRPWPKISVVTPNFNEQKTIERTMLSIIGQRYPNLEYIVMDGGSTDGSEEIIRRYAPQLAYWQSQRDSGQYATINKGFSFATGEIFAWLNSDDIYLPWTLRAVADIFRRFPEIDWIMGQPSTIQDGVVQRVRPCRSYPREWLRLGLFGGAPLGVVQQESCFWRRRLWVKAGPLDEQWRRAADFELWTRFAQHAPLVCCDALLGGFTRTGKNRSVVHADAYSAEVRQIQQALAHRLNSADEARRKTLVRRLDRYARVGHSALWRAIATKLLALDRENGATLRRNFQTQEFVLQEEACLSA